MRKTKRTDSSISLGGIALITLYQAARAGNLTAAIYILDHPTIGHIDVQKLIGSDLAESRNFTRCKLKKGK